MGWREDRAANNGFTWSEQYRHECEVRMVAAMKPLARRRAYMEGVQKVRGRVAWERIAKDLELLWGKRRDYQVIGPTSPDGVNGESVDDASEQGEQTPPGSGSFPPSPIEGHSRRAGGVDSEDFA